VLVLEHSFAPYDGAGGDESGDERDGSVMLVSNNNEDSQDEDSGGDATDEEVEDEAVESFAREHGE
jgi:hypothetical protein